MGHNSTHALNAPLSRTTISPDLSKSLPPTAARLCRKKQQVADVGHNQPQGACGTSPRQTGSLGTTVGKTAGAVFDEMAGRLVPPRASLEKAVRPRVDARLEGSSRGVVLHSSQT